MNIITENIKIFLEEHNIKEVTPEEIGQKVTSYTVEWSKKIRNEERLSLIRLTLPMVSREEIFLGNILLNIFIVKSLEKVLNDCNIPYSVIAEDLGNYFILAINIPPQYEIVNLLKDKLIKNLPDLYFSDENLDDGYYGNLQTMLEFYKSNVEPFPVFIVPEELTSLLEEKVNINLCNLVMSEEWINKLNVIMANIAFFYSYDGMDMQSPSNFLANMVNNYNLIEFQVLADAINLEISERKNEKLKEIIKKSLEIKKDIKTGEIIESKFHKEKLQTLLKKMAYVLSDKAKKEPEKWLCHYLRKGKENKFLQLSIKEVVEKILEGTQFGSTLIEQQTLIDKTSSKFCRLCGNKKAILMDRPILLGQAVNRFYNHLIDHKEREIVCIRCALATYLIVKMLGSHTIGQPQVPKKYNLFFHYGNHSNDEINILNKKLNRLFNMIKKFDEIEKIREELTNNKDKSHIIIPEDIEDPELLLDLLEQQNIEIMPALETFAGTVDIVSPLKSKIFPLTSGVNRLFVIILPQFRYSDKEGPEFIQKRFCKNRLHIIAIMGLLKEVCKCNGSYYYRTTPNLSVNEKLVHTFYIQSKPFPISKSLEQYNLISRYVHKLLYGRYKKNIVEKFILSERLLENPLETFSDILRNSPIRGGDNYTEYKYKRLSTVPIKGQGVFNSIEYLKLFKELSKLEVK